MYVVLTVSFVQEDFFRHAFLMTQRRIDVVHRFLVGQLAVEKTGARRVLLNDFGFQVARQRAKRVVAVHYGTLFWFAVAHDKAFACEGR